MSITTIYYNPRCSKSRQALQILNENSNDICIIKYLDDYPTSEQLTHLIELGIEAKDLVRTNEDEWKELSLNVDECSEKELINAIIEHPIILQRPIVLNGDRAIIARPPERALEVL